MSFHAERSNQIGYEVGVMEGLGADFGLHPLI
jgi:hypothetical protein